MLIKLYDKVLSWAEHRHAERYLAVLSFIEAAFFPIPPDVMLAPMSLARPKLAYRFAFIATAFSVLGGVAGYFIGHFAFEPIVRPLLLHFGYWELYNTVLGWFDVWGFWLMLMAGFSPIPYKLFTVGAGVLNYNLGLFIIGSIIGRAGRFYLVSGLIRWGGDTMAVKLREMVNKTGWIFVSLLSIVLSIKYIPELIGW